MIKKKRSFTLSSLIKKYFSTIEQIMIRNKVPFLKLQLTFLQDSIKDQAKHLLPKKKSQNKFAINQTLNKHIRYGKSP